MKRLILLFLLISFTLYAQEQEYVLKENIYYYEDNSSNTYKKERCKLDLYYPRNLKKFPTVVWFHGGGLKSGNKSVPKELKEQGVAVIAVNYRLHPKVKAPTYIEDAAAAVSWAFKNISSYGGDVSKIIISGSSAGGLFDFDGRFR